tara:strand:- start:330 stop:488 length:159 start_codon:yes stop_codon:yes gene_type:complete
MASESFNPETGFRIPVLGRYFQVFLIKKLAKIKRKRSQGKIEASFFPLVIFS